LLIKTIGITILFFRLYKIISKYINKNIVGVFIDLFHDYKIISNIKYFRANNVELNVIGFII